MSIEVPVDRVNMAFKAVYNSFQKTTDIKGFRKGKAPLSMIKSKYYSQINQKVIELLCDHALREALTEHKEPLANNTHVFIESDCQEDVPFKFAGEFEHLAFNSGHLVDQLTVFKEPFNKANVKKAMDFKFSCMKDFLATEVPVKEVRPLQINDSILINCRCLVRDELAFELNNIHFDVLPADDPSDRDCNSIKLKPRAKSIKDIYVGRLNQEVLYGIEKNISGMKAGETRKFELPKAKKGMLLVSAIRDAYLEIDLKSIYTKKMRDLNETTVKEFGYANMKEMNKEVKEKCKELEDERIQRNLKKSILKELVNQNPFNLPEKRIQEEENQKIIEAMKEDLKIKGLEDDLIEDVVEKCLKEKDKNASTFRENSVFRVKERALVDRLIKLWNIPDPMTGILKQAPFLKDFNIRIKSWMIDDDEEKEEGKKKNKSHNPMNEFLNLTPRVQECFLKGKDIQLSAYERLKEKVVEKLIEKATIKTKSKPTFVDIANPLLQHEEVLFDD